MIIQIKSTGTFMKYLKYIAIDFLHPHIFTANDLCFGFFFFGKEQWFRMGNFYFSAEYFLLISNIIISFREIL